MKAKTTTTRIVFAAVAVLLLTSYGSSLRALPSNEIHRTFYVGCNPDLTEVGTYDIYCNSGVIRSGQQDGDWREDYVTDCNTLETSHYIQKKFNGSWIDWPTLGDCNIIQ